MADCVTKLNLRERLSTFRVATRVLTTDREKGAGYFILLLDMDKQEVSYSRFGKSQLEEATERYNALEETHKNDLSKDVVMVSADSVRDLKKAYPNYFADTDLFERNLGRVYRRYE